MTGGPEEADRLFSDFWEWRLSEWPELASFCGDHRYDDRLNDHTDKAFARRKVTVEDFLSRCSMIDISDLNANRRVSMEILTDELRSFIGGLNTQAYVFPLSNMEGIHIDFQQLTSWMKFETIDDYRKYVSRLEKLPGRIEQDISMFKLGINLGKTFSIYCVNKVPDQLKSLQKKGEETCFYEPFLKCPETLKPEIEALQTKASKLISEQVLPSLNMLKDFIEQTYLPACRPTPGLAGMVGGREFYEDILRWHLSVSLTPQQVYDLGQSEVARIRQEMEGVLNQVSFQGNLKEFFAELRNNSKFYFTNREDLLAAYRDLAHNVIREKLPKLFHKMPKSPLEIVAQAEGKTDGPGAFYLAGTLDGSRPGKFYVNASNLADHAKFNMMTLALHEGEPGHHFQGMYAIEASDMPSFRRYVEDMYYSIAPSRFGLFTAYGEGWGLYCEYLGKELGLYEDPYSLFGNLTYEMFRACRLMADTGLHYMGWDFDKAVNLFLENTPLSKDVVVNECNRYCSIPGQACAYKIGQMKIQELRKNAQQALGEKFDVRDFHEEVLQVGMVPIGVLEKVIEAYIQRKLK